MAGTCVVYGTILRTNTTPWAGAHVVFALSRGNYTASELILANPIRVTTNNAGYFTATLWTNGEGQESTYYTCLLPDGDSFRFIIPDGIPTASAEQLRALSTDTDIDWGETELELIYDAVAAALATNVAGTHTHAFTDLTGAPTSYIGQEDKLVAVRSDATGLMFVPSPMTDRTYRHIQSGATATWTITHNLGKRVSVAIVDTAGSVVTGDVEYLSDNSVRVLFSAAFSGEAYIN